MSFLRVLFLSVSICLSAQTATSPSRSEISLGRVKLIKRSKLSYQEVKESPEFDRAKLGFLHKQRQQLLKDITALLPKTKDLDQKATLLLRLARLYLDDYYGYLALQQEIYRQQLETHSKTKKGKEPVAPDYRKAQVLLQRGRDIYIRVAREYPKHPERDGMLYHIGLSYLDEGRAGEGSKIFEQLFREYPKSKFQTEVLVQLADNLFSKNQFKLAEAKYDLILTNPGRIARSVHSYAAYKKAWCRYNQNDPKVSLAYFKKAIQLDAKASGGAIKVRSEAIKDIVLPFVDLGLYAEGSEFFYSIGEPGHRYGLENMATLFKEKGKYAIGISLWEQCLALSPVHPSNSTYDLHVAESYRLSSNPKKAVSYLLDSAPKYLKGSTWYQANENQPEKTKEAEFAWEKAVRKMALEFHAEGQKSKNKSAYQIASRMYVVYLDLFPTASAYPQIAFNLAEILFKNAKYASSADHYLKAFSASREPKMKEEAMRSAVIALRTQVAEEKKHFKKVTKGNELLVYSRSEERFLEVASNFAKTFPSVKDIPDVIFETAKLQYEHNDFDEAKEKLEWLIANHATHTTARQGARLTLDMLNRDGDYPVLIAACKTFLSNKGLAAELGFVADVSRVLRQSELKRIEKVENEKKYAEAAAEYLKYASSYGKADGLLYEKALYNASVNYAKAELYPEAIQTRENLLKIFPHSGFRKEVIWRLAQDNELLFRFEMAARYLELFASEFEGDAKSPQALRLSGLDYWAAGRHAQAEKVLRRYLSQYELQERQVAEDLFEVVESSGNSNRALAVLKGIQKEGNLSPGAEAALSLRILDMKARMSGKMPRTALKEEFEMASRHQKQLRKTVAGVTTLSELGFWNAQDKDAAFHRVHIDQSAKRIEEKLKTKLALLKELEKEYARIATLGGEWGLGALYRSAYAHAELAREAARAPVPKNLTGPELEKYREGVTQSLVKPFRDRALSLISQCLDKTNELQHLSRWPAACYRLASSIAPDRFPPARLFYLPALNLAMIPGSAKETEYPFDSPELFLKRATPRLSPLKERALEIAREGSFEEKNAIPQEASYEGMVDDRQKFIASVSSDEVKTISDLVGLRLNNPTKAIGYIRKAIERDAKNVALQNLLALSYLDSRNVPAAKVIWFSLLTKPGSAGFALNNLAVVAFMEGKEESGLQNLLDAAKSKNAPAETFVNLGFLALRSRNGNQAQAQFERALEIKDSVSIRSGMAVALLQRGEIEEGGKEILSLSEKHPQDPYVRLCASYFLSDYGRDSQLAKEISTNFEKVAALPDRRTPVDILVESRVPAEDESKEADQAFERSLTASGPEESDEP